MVAWVDIEAPWGETVTLGHGALVGRLWSAELHLNDARVSEAHAMVSLRGRDLRLLALRGRFLVAGRWMSDVVLSDGMTVSLARGLDLRVVAVHVPDEALAVEGPDVARQVLTGVTALFGGRSPRVVAGWDPAADDHLWPTGAAWMRASAGPGPVVEGEAWDVGGAGFRAVLVRAEGARPTVVDADFARPLHLTARFDTVHFARPDGPVVVITGHAARVISELVVAGAALPWHELAAMCWGPGERDLLRHRWDVLLRRMRLKLAANGVRTDLLRADGSGLVELVLGPDDVVVDQT